jgi:hypothetical protein
MGSCRRRKTLLPGAEAQVNNQVPEDRHHLCGRSLPHRADVLAQRPITTTVQAILDPPVVTSQLQQYRGPARSGGGLVSPKTTSTSRPLRPGSTGVRGESRMPLAWPVLAWNDGSGRDRRHRWSPTLGGRAVARDIRPGIGSSFNGEIVPATAPIPRDAPVGCTGSPLPGWRPSNWLGPRSSAGRYAPRCYPTEGFR